MQWAKAQGGKAWEELKKAAQKSRAALKAALEKMGGVVKEVIKQIGIDVLLDWIYNNWPF